MCDNYRFHDDDDDEDDVRRNKIHNSFNLHGILLIAF